MTPADLKKLEQAATPGPWKATIGQCESESGWGAITPFHESKEDDEDNEDSPAAWAASADANLIATLRNLAPELIALWEATKRVAERSNYKDHVSAGVRSAFDALNQKARGL